MKQKWGRNDNDIPVSTLRFISLGELEVGKTHRGCVIYCKVATRVLHSTSAMVLVEDESGIKDLAVYGCVNRDDLRVDRRIAIKEPFYKIRHDGTEGIRIDDPACDLVFDPPEHVPVAPLVSQTNVNISQRATVEERLRHLVREDVSRGAKKLHSQLREEGYSISKKRVRALKRAIQSNLPGKTGSKDEEVPIFSERRPEKHRILKVPAVLENKRAGNEAFQKHSFAAADEFYSKVLDHRNDMSDESVEEVALWQLYSNRAAAPMK